MNKLNWNLITLVLAFAFMIITLSYLFYCIPALILVLLFISAIAGSIIRITTYLVEGR